MSAKGTKSKGSPYKYYALTYRQRGTRGPRLLIFHAPAEDIKAWADVDRMTPKNPTGAQRPLRELKYKKITRYFAAGPENTIPTAIVVALDENAVSFSGFADPARSAAQHGLLTITPKGKHKPGLIIDGQHRVYGAADAAEGIQLNVVALLGADDTERAFQFVVINNSANRVSADHIKALNLSYSVDALNKRLLQSARLGIQEETYESLQVIDRGEESPFRHQLKWQRNAKGFIVSNAVEAALKETRNRSELLGIGDLEIDFFLFIWSLIKKKWPHLWNERTHLLQKVSIVSLTIFILDALATHRGMSPDRVDYTVEATARQAIERAIEKIPEDFWTVQWSVKELDTRFGQDIVVRTLRLITANALNDRPWYEGLEMVSPAAVKTPKRAQRRNKK
jgi:DGQHR domain-containing protein